MNFNQEILKTMGFMDEIVKRLVLLYTLHFTFILYACSLPLLARMWAKKKEKECFRSAREIVKNTSCYRIVRLTIDFWQVKIVLQQL